jgi:hypothetical protein
VSRLLTPPARQIDPRGQRFGAGFSAVILGAAVVVDQPVIVALVAIAMLASAALGTQFWILGKPWPAIRRTLRLGKIEPEHEYPPRFAQTLGSVVLIASLVAFLVGATTIGWGLALAVAGLQSVLGITGYCLGCRMYFLRWWVPAAVTRLWTRGRSAQAAGPTISFR